MFIMDIKNVDAVLSQADAISRIAVNGPRISAILWGALDETIITGHEDGEITLWDVRVYNIFVLLLYNHIKIKYLELLIIIFFYRQEKN